MTTAAVRRNGPYAPLGANYADDDAIALLDMDENDRAELLFCRALAYCARDLRTEGYVSDIALMAGKVLRRRRMDTVMAAAARLAELGLWEREGDGYRITSWLKWNKSWDEMSRKRKADSERKKPHDTTDSTPLPDGFRAESARKDDGIQADSATVPDGVATPLHYTSLHSTSRHDTVPTTSAPDGANESEGQYVNRLTKTYTDVVQLSNFPAVSGVVRKAVRIGTYSEQQITEALARLAGDRRPVTTDTLRIELDGMPDRRPTGKKAEQDAILRAEMQAALAGSATLELPTGTDR